jgi:hypothetical protein
LKVTAAKTFHHYGMTSWHGHHCPNCVSLKIIDELNLARLQQPLKYCATYGVFYQFVEDLEKNKSRQKKSTTRESIRTYRPSSIRNKLNISAN